MSSLGNGLEDSVVPRARASNNRKIVNAFVDGVRTMPEQGRGPKSQLVQEIRDVRCATQMTDQPQLEAFTHVFFAQGGQHALVTVFQCSHLVNDDVIRDAACILSTLSARSPRSLQDLLYIGIVLVLVPFVMHQLAAIRQPVLWFLGKFAQGGHEFRDHVFNNQDIVQGLLQNLQNPMDEEVLKACLWTIANCLRISPQPSSQLAQLFVPHVLTLFNQEVEQGGRPGVLTALLHCVLQLSTFGPAVLDSMFREQEGIWSRTLVLFAKKYGNEHPSLLFSASVILVLQTSVGAAYAEQIVVAGLLDEDCISKFLESRQDLLLGKIALDFLANIAAVAELNVLLFQPAHVLRNLLHAVRQSQPWELRVKAWRVLVNVLTFGTESTVITMCNESMMIRSFCSYLNNAQDDKALTVDMLQAVNIILLLARDGQTLKSAMKTFDLCQLPKIVTELKNSESDEVYHMAVRVLNTLELEADEKYEEDENCAPKVAADQQSFAFGLPKQPIEGGVPQKLPHPSQHSSPLGVLLGRNAQM